jgi:hypothetical protein
MSSDEMYAHNKNSARRENQAGTFYICAVKSIDYKTVRTTTARKGNKFDESNLQLE